MIEIRFWQADDGTKFDDKIEKLQNLIDIINK